MTANPTAKDRLERLRTLLAEGKYHPDPRAIADAMLAHATTNLRLKRN